MPRGKGSRSDGNERSDSRGRFYFARASDSFCLGTLLQAAGSGAAANTRGECADSAGRERGIASVRSGHECAAGCRKQTAVGGGGASRGRKNNRGGGSAVCGGGFDSRGRGAEVRARK